MFKITQKLRSSRGASLILAMVFMLMCLFVGGSVLAAATANGGRVSDLTSSQQSYLSQRSAALLMADMLEGDGNSNLQLTIKRVTVKTKDPTTNTETKTTTVTYSLPSLQDSETYSSLQRILVENAVQRYQNARISTETQKTENFFFTGVNGGSQNVPLDSPLYPTSVLSKIEIKNAAGTVVETYSAASFQITLTDKNGVKIEDLAATFYSKDPKENTNPNAENFDLYFYFDDNSQISLYVKATYSEGNPIEVTQNGITTTTTTTVIRWDDPVIEKGGFSS